MGGGPHGLGTSPVLPSSGRVLMAQACKLAERLPLQAGVTAAVTANTHTHTPTRAHAHVTGGRGAARARACLVRALASRAPTDPTTPRLQEYWKCSSPAWQ